MRGRSILLLGGSRQQLVAIEKAHELGYRTVLCDYLPDNPGRLIADSFHLVSTTDRVEVLDVARSEGVSGVLAYASDPAAPTAAYVAEQLGLPGNPLAAVEALSEKHLFRDLLDSAGLPCPRHVSFPAGSAVEAVAPLLRDLRWPIVVKPTDSSGSKGVSVVGGLEDLDAALLAASARSRNGVLVAEEFIRPGYSHVVGGDVFVVGGEIRFWGLMDCLRDGSRGGLVPVGEVFPTALPPDALNSVRETLQRLVSIAGIRLGELNVEVIFGDDGAPYVLELGARAGGNMIPVQLSDVSGVDLVKVNVLCAMGEEPGDISFEEGRGFFAHVVLHSNRAGIFERVEFPSSMAPHVYRTVLYRRPGDPVSAFADAGDAVGISFLSFTNRFEMEAALSGSGPMVVIR